MNRIHYDNLTKNIFKEKPIKEHFQKTAIAHTIQNNDLSNLFFSQDNINAIQQGIRYKVFKNSGDKHIISNQSETEIKIVMRSIYLQYSRNLPYDIINQVKDLNKKVLDYIVPQILREIKQYLYYKQDISTQPIPLERSKHISSAGTKILYSKEF